MHRSLSRASTGSLAYGGAPRQKKCQSPMFGFPAPLGSTKPVTLPGVTAKLIPYSTAPVGRTLSAICPWTPQRAGSARRTASAGTPHDLDDSTTEPL
jgi:hypothetical protein